MNKKQENKLRYDFVSIGGFISAIVILLFATEYMPQNASSSILSFDEAAVDAGLLEEAKAITVGMILTPIESSCLKSVRVTFQDGRAIEIGTRATTDGVL